MPRWQRRGISAGTWRSALLRSRKGELPSELMPTSSTHKENQRTEPFSLFSCGPWECPSNYLPRTSGALHFTPAGAIPTQAMATTTGSLLISPTGCPGPYCGFLNTPLTAPGSELRSTEGRVLRPWVGWISAQRLGVPCPPEARACPGPGLCATSGNF